MIKSHIIQNHQIASYLCMIKDKWRNNFFLNALTKHASGKVVLDVGTGTGILAFYALKAGAKFVYAIEKDLTMASIADKVLSKKFDRSRFQVINKNFWTDDFDNSIYHQIDLLVAELIGPGLFDQGQFHAWTSIRPFASPDLISIPGRLSVDLYIWDEDVLGIDNMQERGDKAFPFRIFVDEVIDEDFFQALVQVDTSETFYNNALALSNIAVKNRTPAAIINSKWAKTNSSCNYPAPNRIIENFFDYSYDNLPKIEFSDSTYPTNIKPIIKKLIDIDRPSTIALINKLSFEDHTIYLHDALYMPWKCSPVLQVSTAGKYQLEYTNYDFGLLTSTEWTLSLIE